MNNFENGDTYNDCEMCGNSEQTIWEDGFGFYCEDCKNEKIERKRMSKFEKNIALKDVAEFLKNKKISNNVKNNVLSEINNNIKYKYDIFSEKEIDFIIRNEEEFEKGFNSLDSITYSYVDVDNYEHDWKYDSNIGKYFNDKDIVTWARDLYDDFEGYIDEKEKHYHYVNLENLHNWDCYDSHYFRGRLNKTIKILVDLQNGIGLEKSFIE